ncbi:MAG: alkaline phosphatase family protein [Gammaproteobacteria bacterium]
MPAFAMANPHRQRTQTPIRHLVVIFQENVSFDHYFGTYPRAENPSGEPPFHASSHTPAVNGLDQALLTNNPNHDANGNVANPQRLDRSQALTCDEDHGYTAEQKAFGGGLMDKFVLYTDREGCSPPNFTRPNLVMDYYDGNTVTALWNYAQHFAMSDDSFGTVFGPSTPGALNLISGQTHGATPANVTGLVDNGTVISDADPTYDDCSNHSRTTLSMSGENVGNLLNAAGITWGWFEGGFQPTSRNSGGTAVCGSTHTNIGGETVGDYIPHHEPFQYYASTANPHHLPPSSVAAIGHTDQANHQYGLSDFWAAADAGNLPAVSFLKAPGYQDGHAGYSDPLDGQHFIVETINRLERLPSWKSTAVVIAYDDSDGWYDHVMGPIVTQSNDSAYDALVDGSCGGNLAGGYIGRCGYGPRLPLLVISPWARRNFVAHNVTDQSSILRFIETNWNLPQIGDQSADAKAGSIEPMFDFGHGHERDHDRGVRRLFLDPVTGEPEHKRD